jgi:hypothetical protein
MDAMTLSFFSMCFFWSMFFSKQPIPANTTVCNTFGRLHHFSREAALTASPQSRVECRPAVQNRMRRAYPVTSEFALQVGGALPSMIVENKYDECTVARSDSGSMHMPGMKANQDERA